jgi:DNA-binding NarL/FixJ family response regulator
MGQPRVLLADDHRIVAEGLKGILDPEFELVGIVEDGRSLVEAAGKLKPDVIVADIGMPQLNGIDAMVQLKQDNPRVKVVFLTMNSAELVHFAIKHRIVEILPCRLENPSSRHR